MSTLQADPQCRRAEVLADKTRHVPAAALFRDWEAPARLLTSRGFSDAEADLILQSKLTFRTASEWSGFGKCPGIRLASALIRHGIRPGDVTNLVPAGDA
jgi:hypothetical protein